MELKPYPMVKNSGIEWLGEVPETWQILRGKFLFCCVDERSRDGEEELLTVSSKRGVVPRSSTKVTMFKAASYIGYKLCWPGDLVINSLWAWAQGLGVSRYHGIISSAYGVYRLCQHYSRYSEYVHRLVRSIPFNYELRVRSKGIWVSRLQLTDEAFLDAPFPIPPAVEITAIVRYLDYADRRIQRYIRAKQKLIALLKEQKQAIIHQAVTGQIDVRTGQPYPAYKPSGVEFLGDVPTHWEIKKLGRCGNLLKGNGGNKEDEVPKGVPCIRYGDLYTTHTFFITESRSYISTKKVDKYTALQYGDVLFAASGETIAEIGKSAVNLISSEACCGGDIILFRPKLRFDARYLGYLTDCWVATSQKSVMGRGITVMHIYGTQLKNLVLPIAPTTEQNAIAHFLDDATVTVDDGIARAQCEIDLLHEYRTRLISDVVTGKLDVREAASILPEVDPLAGEDTLNVTLDNGSESDIHELDVIPKEART